MSALPRPGLSGNYADACVVCLRGTDTGIGLVADEAEAIVATLIRLGVESMAAPILVADATGSDPGKVPDGETRVLIRLCRRCADRSDLGLKPGLWTPDEIPIYRYRGSS